MGKKEKNNYYWRIYWTGCFFLGSGTTLLFGLKSIPFGIGLILMIASAPYLKESSR